MPFSPDYVRIVLNENFEDAKALFLDPLMAIHYAHLCMLRETGIVSLEDARTIKRALDAIDLDAVRNAKYDGSYEDLFFLSGTPGGGRVWRCDWRPPAHRAQSE